MRYFLILIFGLFVGCGDDEEPRQTTAEREAESIARVEATCIENNEALADGYRSCHLCVPEGAMDERGDACVDYPRTYWLVTNTTGWQCVGTEFWQPSIIREKRAELCTE